MGSTVKPMEPMKVEAVEGVKPPAPKKPRKPRKPRDPNAKPLTAPEIKEGTGKLKGRFCVRVPGTTTDAKRPKVKMLGCFKSREAAAQRVSEVWKPPAKKKG